MGTTAWGDESIRTKGPDQPAYLPAASRMLTGEQPARAPPRRGKISRLGHASLEMTKTV